MNLEKIFQDCTHVMRGAEVVRSEVRAKGVIFELLVQRHVNRARLRAGQFRQADQIQAPFQNR